MEGKNKQKSAIESNFFQIPIEEYEEDMESESSKEKKKEILELFTAYNKLRSKEEFNEIKDDLHDACIEGDLELIKILLSETVENSSNTFSFKIDRTNQTASLFKVNGNIEECFIPRTFKHESIEYLITSIKGTGFDVRTIKFSENSAVKFFYRNAFSYSMIKKIYFPASLKELKKGWCCNAFELKRIIISPSNGQFKFIDNKYLIGKSESNNDEFDTLLFVRLDIKEFSIPSNIKIISSYAFNYTKIKKIFIPSNVTKICEYAFYNSQNLKKVEIPTNSNLQTIESYAFSSSNVEDIFIPSNVTKICKGAFLFCQNFREIKIPTNSNLQTIESYAFSSSKIKEIYFPASLKELKNGWCCDTSGLIKITISSSNGQFKFIDDKYLIGKSESNSDEFDTLLFVRRDIEEFSIPSNIKIISSYAFQNCENLIKVEIPTDSNLQTIESNAFAGSSIESVFIPSKVTKICEGAFSNCDNLIEVEIPTNSNLQTIESNAFAGSYIEEIYFPASLKELKEGWCCNTSGLIKITISPSNGQFRLIDDKYLVGKSESNNDEFDTLLFVCRDIENFSISSNIKIISSYAFDYSFIESIFIPTNITKICEGAFSDCFNLIKVDIPINSNLQTIESNSFSDSNIESIFIPSKVTKICENAFSNCENLRKVEIPTNSNLQTIESYAFSSSNVESIFIPSKVIKICEGAFSDCKNLKEVEISEESELESLPSPIFDIYERPIVMIPSSLRKLTNNSESI